MLKNILNLEGAQQLTNKEQKAIKGGIDKYHCYLAVTKDECTAIGGKWDPYMGMCVTNEANAEFYGYSCTNGL